jgi:hypothetical protein
MVLSDEWVTGMAAQASAMDSDASAMGGTWSADPNLTSRGNLRDATGNIYQLAGELENMGIISNETLDILHKIAAIVVLGTSFYMMYAGVRMLVTSLIAANTVAATAETAAHVAMGPGGWAKIAIAVGAMAAVAGAFAIGYQLGQDNGDSGDVDVTYSGASLDSPGGMSATENGMREVMANG